MVMMDEERVRPMRLNRDQVMEIGWLSSSKEYKDFICRERERERSLCSIRSLITCVSYAEAYNRYRLEVCLSVCPSVRPSHAGTVSKRLNILPCFLHHTIAHSF